MASRRPLSDPFVQEPGAAPDPEPDALTALALSPSAEAAARAWGFMPAEPGEPPAEPAPPALTGVLVPPPGAAHRNDAEATLACLAMLTLRTEALAIELGALRQEHTQLGDRLAQLEAKGVVKPRPTPGDQSTVALVVGAAQTEHDCAVVDAAGRVHGPCRLNRWGHCPKCYTTAMFNKSRA